MVIMALDHTRDFFHAGAMTFSPEDLARTTPVLFFTRWITHICAPVFLFTAGVGAFLRLQRPGTTTAQLSRFLWTRGLWLVHRRAHGDAAGDEFLASPRAIPCSCSSCGRSAVHDRAGGARPPARAACSPIASIAVILLHNAFDGVQAAQFGALSGIWNVLHQPGVFFLGGIAVVAGYPLVPWVAVMAAGFCAGPLLLRQPQERRRALLLWGTGLVVAFVVLRALNIYGDPQPWSAQSSPLLTAISFLRTTKYPPSLAFLLMTLGPALLLLAYFDRRAPTDRHPLVVIGRVPFFYYVAHFWLLHLLASFMAWTRYGSASLAYLFNPLPSMGGPAELFPAGFGYPLWVTYAVWIGLVLLLYPACRWFAAVKARRRDWWLSYL